MTFYTIFLLSLVALVVSLHLVIGNSNTSYITKVGTGINFECTESSSQLLAKNVVSIVDPTNSDTYFIGYRQVSSINKDPRVAKFRGTTQLWCRNDYETTGDDNVGYGIMLDLVNSKLYGIFSATGTQTGDDFRRFASGSWFPSYGQGGGPKVSVIARISTQTGQVEKATYIRASLSNGNANSVEVRDLCIRANGTQNFVVASMNSFFSPVTVRKRTFSCSGSSPFDWRVALNTDFNVAVSSCVLNRTNSNNSTSSCEFTGSNPLDHVCLNSWVDCDGSEKPIHNGGGGGGGETSNLQPKPQVSSTNIINMGWCLNCVLFAILFTLFKI